MGQTSECIEWGIAHGLDGQGAIPHFTKRLNGYDLPYIDGYQRGYLLRKAGANGDGYEITSQDEDEYDRLNALATMPRYPKGDSMPIRPRASRDPKASVEAGFYAAEEKLAEMRRKAFDPAYGMRHYWRDLAELKAAICAIAAPLLASKANAEAKR